MRTPSARTGHDGTDAQSPSLTKTHWHPKRWHMIVIALTAIAAMLLALGLGIPALYYGLQTKTILHSSTEVILQPVLTPAETIAPAVISFSGQLPLGKNLFIIKNPGHPNGVPIAVTLPADMAPYVGRRITVCAAGMQYATLTLLGDENSWTNEPARAAVVQFGLRSATGVESPLDQPRCCVTFDVMTPSSVNVIGRSTCTIYCTTTTADCS